MVNSNGAPNQQNGLSILKRGVGLVVILGMVLLELPGCKSSHRVTDKDFSEHDFAAAIAYSANTLGLRKPGMSVTDLNVEYWFKNDKTGQIWIEQGFSAKPLAFSWQVEGDSLLVTMNNTKGGLFIQMNPNGYTLSNKHMMILLTR